jgi:hypothetical protein
MTIVNTYGLSKPSFLAMRRKSLYQNIHQPNQVNDTEPRVGLRN